MADQLQPTQTSERNLAVQQRTSELIIEVMNGLMYDGEYEQAMMGVLETLGKAVNADRLYILEIRQRLDSAFVEWCAEGVQPRLAALAQISDAALAKFTQQFRGIDVVFAPTLDDLKVDELSKGYFRRMGVSSLFSLPLRKDGRAVGVVGADNYSLKDDYDYRRLLNEIGPCMATVISNHQLHEELEWSGTHDALTGLLNRRGIDLSAAKALEADPDQPFALGLLDIDDFKKINDLYGHAAGDKALVNISQMMRNEFPPSAVLGRNGGDEMLILLFGNDAGRACELFERFASLPFSIEDDGKVVSHTVSLGYACRSDRSDSIVEAYKLSDAALYAAKLAGKAQAVRYSQELDVRYRAQLGFTPRDIAENIPGGIMVHRVGGDGEILFANKSMPELYGCTDVIDFIGYVQGSFRYAVHDDDNEQIYEEIIRQASPLAPGAEFHVDYRIVTKGGSVREVAENGQVVELEGIGLVIYAIVMDHAGHTSY